MPQINKYEWLFFTGIILIAFLFRYVNVGVPALTSDEGDLVKSVNDVLEIGVFTPWEYWGGLTPPMIAWGTAFFVMIFGLTEWSLRLFVVLCGVLSVGCVYGLARLHYGVKVAQTAALLSAVVPLSVLTNRYGPNDSPLLLFALLAILCWEYGNRCRYWWSYILGGVMAGVTLFTKYNGIIIFSLYWLVILIIDVSRSQRKVMALKDTCKKIIVTCSFALMTLFLSFGGDVMNVLYFTHGILFWMINQNIPGGGYVLPWFYSLSIFFDGLSPLLFIVVPIAGVILLFKPSRENLLHNTLCFVFIAMVMSGARRFPRHFLLAMPFAMIVVGKALDVVHEKIKKKNIVWLLLLLLVLSAGGWSTRKIIEYTDYVVWKEAGSFILENTNNNISVFVHGGEYWSLKYYTKDSRHIISRLNTGLLKEWDVVIVHRINTSTNFFTGSPLLNDLTLYKKEYAKQFSLNDFVDFYAFVRKYGVRLKTFSYDRFGNEIDVYQMGGIKKNVRFSQEIYVPIGDPMTKKACSIWMSDTSLKRVLLAIIPKDFQDIMTKKCTRGCVNTCGMF
ncbi:glycosyltransferase family 39 protein [Candidatus Woesearchaeota archaeon]|nr:glycosyltransferase family 39 protein [Candidatus Woesearchaeota archaeon]